MLKMSDSEIKNYLDRCKKYAGKRGYSQCGDDFAQDAIIKIICGRKASISQLFIDFLRKEYGDTRASSHISRSTTISLDQPISRSREQSEENGSLLHEYIGSSCREPEPLLFNWRDESHFGVIESIVADLALNKELSSKEIADYLGVSPSRISQILNKIKKNIESSVFLSQIFPEYKSDRDASILIIDWITL